VGGVPEQPREALLAIVRVEGGEVEEVAHAVPDEVGGAPAVHDVCASCGILVAKYEVRVVGAYRSKLAEFQVR